MRFVCAGSCSRPGIRQPENGRPLRANERVINITGVGARGAWTLETVNGLNYWWKSFEPATIHMQLNEKVVLRLLSADVFHQFYVPALGIGPVDVEPGYIKEDPLLRPKRPACSSITAPPCAGDATFTCRAGSL